MLPKNITNLFHFSHIPVLGLNIFQNCFFLGGWQLLDGNGDTSCNNGDNNDNNNEGDSYEDKPDGDCKNT